MAPIFFHVVNWQAWSPERPTAEAWRLWAGTGSDTGPGPADGSAPVPMLLRRRVGALGQQALRAAWSMPQSASARLVFASRHGEFPRTLSIMDSLAAGEPVLPADFTLSVHHALAGLLSIARSNHHGHTAIAAGRDSFGCGLLEAAACLAEKPDEPVLFVYYDEQLPSPFSDFDEDGAPLAVALTLAAGGGSSIGLTLSARPADMPVSRTPAEDFLRFLLDRAPSAASPGERHLWRWTR
nr:beta-ketoacyl synthase chain length factor [Telmatospirillum siberiense]